MIESLVDIPTEAGAMATFIAHPGEGGPFPAVILYMDVWGIRDELFDIARGVAAVGYYCMVPDLYHRLGKVRNAFYDDNRRMISFHLLDEKRRQEALQPLLQLKDQMVVEDTAAMIRFVDGQHQVREGAMGCFGYCLGGRLILRVAGAYPQRFKACAGMHGTDLVTDQPDSPHLVARNAEGELYLGFGELDQFAQPPVVETVAKSLAGRAFRYRYAVHQKIQHGYALPDRDVYDKAATVRDWEAIFAMFHRQIPPGFER